MIHSFRDSRAWYPCATCGKEIEGIPMDRGDFLIIHTDAEHPHPVQPKPEQPNA